MDIVLKPASLIWVRFGWLQTYTLFLGNGGLPAEANYPDEIGFSPCNSEGHSVLFFGPGSQLFWFSVPTLQHVLFLITVVNLFNCMKIYRMDKKLSSPIIF